MYMVIINAYVCVYIYIHVYNDIYIYAPRIVESLIVQEEGLVRVFHQLVEAQHSIVWLDHSVGDFGGWDHREGLLGCLERRHTPTKGTACYRPGPAVYA